MKPFNVSKFIIGAGISSFMVIPVQAKKTLGGECDSIIYSKYSIW